MSTFIRRVVLSVVTVAASLLVVSVALAQYQIIDLGDLGGGSSEALGINNLGQVVGNSRTAGYDGRNHAFLYSPWTGVMEDLGTLTPGGGWSVAEDINDSGVIAGRSTHTEDGGAFVYVNHTMQNLGTLGGVDSEGFAINASDQIVGWSETSAPWTTHAFLRTGTEMLDLGSIDGGSMAYGINDLGQVVGMTDTPDADFQAFLHSGGTMIDIRPQYGEESVARDVNNHGQVVGNMGQVSSEGAIWMYDGGVTTFLEVSEEMGNYGRGYAINDAGHIVGFSRPTAGGSHAFLYADGVMRDLNNLAGVPEGWYLRSAHDINEQGWIVGTMRNMTTGKNHGFLAIPEPATVGLVVLGLVALAARRGRRRL